MMENGIAAVPQTSPEHSMYLNNMGIALRERFLRTGSVDDLERGIVMIKQAVAATPSDNIHLCIIFGNLKYRIGEQISTYKIGE